MYATHKLAAKLMLAVSQFSQTAIESTRYNAERQLLKDSAATGANHWIILGIYSVFFVSFHVFL